MKCFGVSATSWRGSFWRLLVAVIVVYACKPWHARRYRKLLARIERLEIELGLREAPALFGPGAKWLVNDPGDIQYVTRANLTQIQRQMNPYGLLASAEFKRRVTEAAFYGKKEAA